MARNNAQAAAYHGVSNVKYAVRKDGAPGESVVKLNYAKTISFEPQIEEQAVYANNAKVMALVSDMGYTGSLGTTAQDRGLELALGHVVETAQGQATVNLLSHKRVDLYYEYREEIAGVGAYTVKVWALNAEVGKATTEHSTDESTATVGEYSYPFTVYGETIMNAAGTAAYRDANGNELTATRVVSLPGDEGYETFGDAVPAIKMPTAVG